MKRTSARQAEALLAPEVGSAEYFFVDLSPRALGPVAVAFGGRERCGERYGIQRSTYPFSTLEYIAEGEALLQFGDGEVQTLGPGACFAHGPGVPVRLQTAPGATLLKYFVCFSGRGARAKIEAHAPTAGAALRLTRHGELRDVFDLLIREGTDHTPFTSEICTQLGFLLLLKINAARRHRSGGRQGAARERFLRCKALIDEQGARFSSLEEVAAALHAEPSGINRLFRRYQGVSPYQYLLRHKMNLAAQDLIRSGGYVKEAAARAGYGDPYHFSRVFKAVHGISPAHFQRLHASPSAGAR